MLEAGESVVTCESPAAVLARITDAVFALDRDWRVTYANSAAADLFRRPLEEFIGCHFWTAFPALVDTRYYQQCHHALATQQSVEFTAQLEYFAGNWVHAHLYPSPTGLTICCTDITTQHQAEAQLRQQERMFRALIEQSAEYIMVIGADGTVRYDTPSDPAGLGYTTEEFTGSNIFALVHPDEVAHARSAYAQLLTQPGATQRIELRVRAKDGSWHVLEVDASNLLHDPAVQGIVMNARDITERKQAEKALEESEERFRHVLEHSLDAVYRRNLQTDSSDYMSPAVTRSIGFTPTEMAAMSMEDVLAHIHPDDLARVQQQIEEILLEGEGLIEYRFKAKNGQYHWLADTMCILPDNQGQPLYRVGVARDITERKQVEEALRASEKRFRSLAETAPAAIAIIQGTRICYANPYMSQTSGYTQEELLSLPFAEILHPDIRAMMIDRAQRRLQGESVPVRYELKGLTKTGEERWYDFSVTVIDYAEQPAILVISFDITARKQAEEALARERAFLDAAIQLLPLPLAFVDTNRDIMLINEATREWFNSIGADNRQESQLLDPLTHVPLAQDDWPAARALRGEVVRAENLLFYVPSSGQEIPCLISAAPVYVEGEIVAAGSLIEDITALKEADRAKDEFLAVLSHELQTPLTSILGWSDLALTDPRAEFLQQAAEVIHRNARRQQILIADMLDMSRLIHRKLMLEPVRTDLALQARHAVETVQHQAAKRQITLRLHESVTPLPIQADPVRLQQCLGNLLHNSLKFTPAGGAIDLTCTQQGPHAQFTIHDTGRGIAPAALPHLFTIFQQTNRDEHTGGLGLGLAVTRGIIELHGGRIQAASAGEGHGCTFTIILPLAELDREPPGERGPVSYQ